MSQIMIIALIWGGLAIGIFLVFAFSGLLTAKGTEKFITKNAEIAMKAQNNIVKNNHDMLKETANQVADINKDAVETIMHSVKEGLSDNNSIYCKYCGEQIDADSSFCKKCGKQL